ncbi:MAG: WG repeat-containing protein [Bryobacterales bacterium]|nr:WG repeat-containing protein [Bryobacterales bacterium]
MMRRPLSVCWLLAIAAVAAESDPLFRIREDRKIGFIDRTGKVVIVPKFETAEDFYDGLARVYVGAEAGFIDRSGKFVIKPVYATATNFENGRSLVSRDGKYSLIDKQGNTVAEIPYRVLGEFHAGLATVQRPRATDAGGKPIPAAYGYIDRAGKMVIEPRFMPAGAFPDDGRGLAVGGLNREWVYFDRTGKIILRLPMEGRDRADAFQDGLLRWKEGFYWGYRNAAGEWAIEARYDAASDFKDGLARVELDGKWVWIDRSGRQVDAPLRERVGNTAEGLTLYREGDRLGYLKADGAAAFPFRRYQEARDFSCGLARIKLDGRFGFLDSAGNLKLPNVYASAGDFTNCLAMVLTKYGFAYIDPEGKVVWQQKAKE